MYRMEKKMATHSSILDWRIPWTEEPGGLLSMGHKELDTTEQPTLIYTKLHIFQSSLGKDQVFIYSVTVYVYGGLKCGKDQSRERKVQE